MTSAEIGALALSNVIKESHTAFGSDPAAERFALNSDFKSASSSARKSFGAGLVSVCGAGVCKVSFGIGQFGRVMSNSPEISLGSRVSRSWVRERDSLSFSAVRRYSESAAFR
jgi:hypothetical protein